MKNIIAEKVLMFDQSHTVESWNQFLRTMTIKVMYVGYFC